MKFDIDDVEPNIYTCLEKAEEDIGLSWLPTIRLPCGGLVVCRERDDKLAYKRFTCHEFDPDAEFPVQELAIRCVRVKAKRLHCPAMKRLLKAFGIGDEIIREREFPIYAGPANPYSFYLRHRAGSGVDEGNDKKAFVLADIYGARRTHASDMCEIFEGLERETHDCGYDPEDVHGGILSKIRKIFKRAKMSKIAEVVVGAAIMALLGAVIAIATVYQPWELGL